MRWIGCAASALLLTLSACVHDPSSVSAWAGQDAGSDTSGAPTSTESTSSSGSSVSAASVDESAGGAECLTADGAPYVAPRC